MDSAARRRVCALVLALAVVCVAAVAGCDGRSAARPPAKPRADRSYTPITVGPGARYRPPPGPAPPVGGACATAPGRRAGVHLELFANRHVILIPAGIGVAAPRRGGPYVTGGACFYPLITLEPTGVVELARGARPRLHDLFALWGQPLSATRLAGFTGPPVEAYVDGRAVGGDPGRIILRRHEEIVLEIAGHVAPHSSYGFAGGL